MMPINGVPLRLESAKRHAGRKWNEVESDLQKGWTRLSTAAVDLENIKDAVRDAWDRVTGGGDKNMGADRGARGTY